MPDMRLVLMKIPLELEKLERIYMFNNFGTTFLKKYIHYPGKICFNK